MLVLSSPSGAGKTTISRRLLGNEKRHHAVGLPYHAREAQRREADGKDYHFIDQDAFTQMRDEGEFLEWAVVFDNYYGTTRKPGRVGTAGWSRRAVRRRLAGCRRPCARRAAGDVVAVFILPPSAEALEERLKARAEDPPRS